MSFDEREIENQGFDIRYCFMLNSVEESRSVNS